MKRLLDTVLSAAFAVGMVSSATSAPISEVLLQNMKSAQGTQRIIVTMKDAPGGRMAIHERSGDRASAQEALKQNSALAQASILQDLQGMGFAEGAEVKTSWLANCLILDATPEQIQALAARDDVLAVDHNGQVSIPDFQAQEVSDGKTAPGDDNVSTWGLKASQALEARQNYGVDGTGVLVGILDTGYDGAHPLLAGKVAAWKSFISDTQTEPMDDNGHGSHCAGTVGGSSGGGMEIGMAPGVKFVVGKILSGSGSGSWEGVIGGMEWVVDPDGQPNSGDEPKLVSNSWGGGRGSAALHNATKAWKALGVAPIFAAGNSGPGARTTGYPGAYPEAYAVGATASNKTIASFSSRGPATVDGVELIKPEISAPGKDVTSVKANKPNEYWTISGTSMATPHVAGLAALLFQANPGLSADELFSVINETSHEAGPAGKDNDFGWGRINALEAVGMVISGGRAVGSVKDSQGNAIAYAKATINETGANVRISDDGSFKTALKEGTYSLTVKAFGFETQTVNGIVISAGEETSVNVTLANAASGSITGTLTGAGSAVQGKLVVLDTPLAAIETAEDGSFSMNLPAGTYKIAASAFGYEVGTTDEFTVAAGSALELAIDLADLPPVLLVDDDDGKNYETFFAAAMGNTAHNLVSYSDISSQISGDFLSQYEVVVWFTGSSYKGSLKAEDQAALAAYLDRGGRLFVSGQDIGYELKSKSFLAERLGAKFVKDKSDDLSATAFGVSFQLNGGDSANNQKYPDVLEAAGNGAALATYGNGTAAGTKVENGNSKVAYLGFGLEGIDTAANRAAVMSAALEYLSPSAEEMAQRLDSVAAEGADEALVQSLAQSLRNDAAEGQGRVSRRVARFEALHR